MEKVLITGASGMLGRYVVRFLENTNYEVIAPSSEAVNLSNLAGIKEYIERAKPSAILHLAAETDVDLCERDPARAGLYNHLATDVIARAAAACGAWVLYVSTSGIFGGDAKPIFNELDFPSPVNYYARSKFWGERAIGKHCPDNSLIVRAGWMIGGGAAHDHKFIGKIIKQIADGAEVLRAVTDKYGTITRAEALANFIVASLKIRRRGLFHYASTGVTTRFEIAKAVANFTNFKGKVEGVPSSLYPLSAPRPTFDGIESIYLGYETDAVQPNSWEDDVRAYMKEFNI